MKTFLNGAKVRYKNMKCIFIEYLPRPYLPKGEEFIRVMPFNSCKLLWKGFYFDVGMTEIEANDDNFIQWHITDKKANK